jgi:hypothetical protein
MKAKVKPQRRNAEGSSALWCVMWCVLRVRGREHEQQFTGLRIAKATLTEDFLNHEKSDRKRRSVHDLGTAERKVRIYSIWNDAHEEEIDEDTIFMKRKTPEALINRQQDREH